MVPGEPLISFIIPVYNAESSLERCLQSVVTQLMNDIELIVVDDGSTDQSQKIMNRYADEYPRQVTALKKTSSGTGEGRNAGIRRARGRYVAFIDSDDYIEPGYVDSIIREINNHDPDMIIIDYNRIYTRPRNVFEQIYRFNRRRIYSGVVNIESQPELLATAEVAPWLRIIRRSIFVSHSDIFFSRSRLGEDLEASLKWYLHTVKIRVLDKKLYNYVIKPGSLNFVSDNLLDYLQVLKSVCSYYRRQQQFESFYPQLEYLFTKHLIIAGLLRLWSAGGNDSYAVFRKLREGLLAEFPGYAKNKLLEAEPLYLRMAVKLSFKYPELIKWFLFH